MKSQESGNESAESVNLGQPSPESLTPDVQGKLVKALQPFANAASVWESFDGQHDYLDSDSANNITVGDLRRAREALALLDGQNQDQKEK